MKKTVHTYQEVLAALPATPAQLSERYGWHVLQLLCTLQTLAKHGEVRELRPTSDSGKGPTIYNTWERM